MHYKEIGSGTYEIVLPPGLYFVATHRVSPCGYWGGDSYQSIEVKEGERTACAIPFRKVVSIPVK